MKILQATSTEVSPNYNIINTPKISRMGNFKDGEISQ